MFCSTYTKKKSQLKTEVFRVSDFGRNYNLTYKSLIGIHGSLRLGWSRKKLWEEGTLHDGSK